MTRWWFPAALLALCGLLIYTVAAPEATYSAAGDAWFPDELSRGGEIVDGLFDTTNLALAALAVSTFTLIAWCVWRGAGRSAGEGGDSAGSRTLEITWTIVPAVLLAFLTWIQLDARAEMRDLVADESSSEPAVVIDVEGAQFDWRFRYAGADGVLGNRDDVVEVVELRVPIGRIVELHMRSTDVIHSFFVPALRLKRDLVPGAMVPLRFQIDPDDYEAAGSPATLDLQCAELCGWGHYAMIGRLRPMDPVAFDAWLAAESEGWFAGGNLDEDSE